MNLDEAAKILSAMHVSSQESDKGIQASLFGIKYAEELEGLSIEKLVALAQGPKSYVSEVYMGRRLAGYVSVKE
jgi:hypothetical protein